MKKITFFNRKGGSGKTTTLALFALALSRKGKKVAVLDNDPLEVAEAFVECLEDENIEVFNPKGEYDVVLIDTGGGIDPKEVKKYEKASDFLILPMGLNALDIGATVESIKALKQSDKSRILLNKISTRTQAFKQKKNVLSALPLKSLKNYLSLRVSYQYIIGEGWSALDKKAKDEVFAVLKELNILN